MAAKSPRAFPNLTGLSHPLIQHKLTILRDKRTSTRDFKQLVNEIAMLMAYEVTKDISIAISFTSCLKSRVLVRLSRKIVSLCWINGCASTVRLGNALGDFAAMNGESILLSHFGHWRGPFVPHGRSPAHDPGDHACGAP